MKLVRDTWTPLTVTFETHEEAEIMHKILAMTTDDTNGRDAHPILMVLFTALGKGLDVDARYRVSGNILVEDAWV